jgi:hypothetical protein
MANDKAQMLNQAQNPKQCQMTKRFLPPERPDFINFLKNSPLKIRGARGVMKIMEITPFNPPYFKGEV